MEPTPSLVEVKAIDVIPYEWALWCAVEGGKPHANEIVARHVAEDGTVIFGLDSHNAFSAKADTTLWLVPKGSY